MAIPSVPHSTYEEFRNAVNGRGFDLDNFGGFQCWDGVDLLYQQSDVGQYLYTARNVGQGEGTAKSCWLNETARRLNGSGHFSIITDKTQIKRGDIIVFNTYQGWYGSAGHIAFADEDYNGTEYIDTLGQNQGAGANPDTGTPFNIRNNLLGSAFLGVFRYDGWQQPVPPTPTSRKKRHFPYPVAWNNWGWGM